MRTTRAGRVLKRLGVAWLGFLLWGLVAWGSTHAQEATPPPPPAATVELLPTETLLAAPEGSPLAPTAEGAGSEAAPRATATLFPSPEASESEAGNTPNLAPAPESLSERLIERALPLAVVLFVLGSATLIVVLAHLLRTRVR